jgi:hypothetical protein
MPSSASLDSGVETRTTRWRARDAAVLAQGAAAVLFAVSETFADVDLWWHLRLGDDLLATKALPWRDAYSYLASPGPYVNHEWLAELAMSAAFAVGGDAGLVLLKLLLVGIVGVLLGRWLLRSGAGLLPSTLLTVVALFLFAPGLGTVRPQLFSYLLLTLTLLCLAASGTKPRRAWWLPAIVAAWTNVHGAVVAGLGVIVVWAVVDRILPDRRVERLPLLPVVAACAALAVNPWGLQILDFLRGALHARPELTEWNPIEVRGLEGVLYGATLGIAAIGMLGGPRRPAWSAVSVVGITAVAPLLARRHLPFFVLASTVLAGPGFVAAVSYAVTRRWPSATSRGAGRPWHPWIVGALFAEAAVLAVLAWPRVTCIRVDPAQYPIEAIVLMQNAGATGRAATFFDWGGMVLDALGPGLQVSMDPRRETVYGDDAYALNEAFTQGLGEWDLLLDREPRPDLALVSKAFPTFNLMRTRADWTLVHDDVRSGLFVRDGASLAQAMREARLPALAVPACFAEARAWLRQKHPAPATIGAGRPGT